jgi:hypothetical protein
MPMSEKCNLFVRKSELFHLVKVWYDDKVPNKYSTKLRCISIRIEKKNRSKALVLQSHVVLPCLQGLAIKSVKCFW